MNRVSKTIAFGLVTFSLAATAFAQGTQGGSQGGTRGGAQGGTPGGSSGSQSGAPTTQQGSPQTRTDEGATATAAPSKQDIDFFHDAAQGGLLEVRLGQMAVQKSTNEEVKRFAQRMLDDHGKLNTKLNQVVQHKPGMAIPTDIDTKHRKVVDDLNKESGAKFDRDYMSKMVDEHQNDVKAFEKQAKDGTDPQLKAAAAEALPTLYEHLDQAKQILERLKK